MPIQTWVLWAFILILQNFAFTFVSRARNSGSLPRHMIAGFFSNGVWFVSQILIFTQLFKIMTGQYGWPKAVGTSLYYTAFTLIGSLLAHYYSLVTEKGKSAVGASKKYVQITPEEWEHVKSMAGAAYDITVGMIPATSITAKKLDGAPVLTGLPEDPDPRQFMTALSE